MKKVEKTRECRPGKKKPVSIRAIKKSLSSVMKNRGDLFVAIDDTFGIALVYAYGSFDEYNSLRESLFGDKDKLRMAYGYCSHGILKSTQSPCILVWVNSKAPKSETLPWFMHELSHLVDFIIEDAQIDDRSGEARAYLLERETKRVLDKLFNMKSASPITEKQVLEVLK